MNDVRNSICLDCKCMRACLKLKDGWVCPDCIVQRLAAAEAERDECKRLWKEACRVKDVKTKGGRGE